MLYIYICKVVTDVCSCKVMYNFFALQNSLYVYLCYYVAVDDAAFVNDFELSVLTKKDFLQNDELY